MVGEVAEAAEVAVDDRHSPDRVDAFRGPSVGAQHPGGQDLTGSLGRQWQQGHATTVSFPGGGAAPPRFLSSLRAADVTPDRGTSWAGTLAPPRTPGAWQTTCTPRRTPSPSTPSLRSSTSSRALPATSTP
ncbi:hypothetical protein FRIGORI9N_450080 [Frigoribacterium sp. 9N]|nr:hypothetical protein FRIGORI9N_450080 [Frigoribacterium sp. 9N]